jgi:tRNA dimethylallyltransferase
VTSFDPLPNPDATPVLILTGTTASGKNRMGARLAARFGGEVLSLDSMKVYRGMDVGTAKPDAEDLKSAPHHLVDLLDPKESMNLRRFVDLAHAARREVASRGRIPVVVGGTQLYLKGFLDGVFDGPPQDAAFRAALRSEAERDGVPKLHERLSASDPAAAARIHRNDYKRIERALEVAAATGRPLSEMQAETRRPPPFPKRLYVLTWRRDRLNARIDARVEAMFREGFVDEVRRILDAGGFGRESGEALGYAEAVAVARGESSEAAAVADVRRLTRRFARKQETWLRKAPADLRFEVSSESEWRDAEAAIAADFERVVESLSKAG